MLFSRYLSDWRKRGGRGTILLESATGGQRRQTEADEERGFKDGGHC